MEISRQTKELINELIEFSGGRIKNPLELSLLVEQAGLSDKEKLFADIQFTAKYINGLTKILQTNVAFNANSKDGVPPPSPEEARTKVMEEYKKNVVKITGYIKDLLIETQEPEKSELVEKYLSLNRESMINLTSLIYDLSWLKKFYNSRRGR